MYLINTAITFIARENCLLVRTDRTREYAYRLPKPEVCIAKMWCHHVMQLPWRRAHLWGLVFVFRFWMAVMWLTCIVKLSSFALQGVKVLRQCSHHAALCSARTHVYSLFSFRRNTYSSFLPLSLGSRQTECVCLKMMMRTTVTQIS